MKYSNNRPKKINLREQAYLQLRSDILNNKIKPGDFLSENTIANELNMSRTPVREALRMLASEDLVEIKDGIGIYVKTISFQDIKSIFEVRKVLETLAIKTSINRITIDEIEKLEKDFNLLLNDFKNGITFPEERLVEMDWELDNLIVKKCSNDYVITIMEEINAKVKRYQSLSLEALNDAEESINQHLNILSLLKKKDIDAIVEANEKHIDWALGCFMQ